MNFLQVPILGLVLILQSTLSPAQKTWYVSPQGKDSQTGLSTQRPFRTLEKALDALRREKKQPTAEYRIILRGGTYAVSEPIRVDSRLGLGPQNKLTISAQADEAVVLSGNRTVQGTWQSVEPGLWKVPVKGYFNQLFIDGKRAIRARFPNEGTWLEPDTVQVDQHRLVFTGKLPSDLAKVAGAELHITGFWHYVRQKIARFDIPSQTVLTADYPGPEASSRKIENIDRAHFENALLFADIENEWFLDSLRQELYLVSKTNPASKTIEYPVASTLLVLEGQEDAPLQRITLQGIRFTGTDWALTPIGRKGIQAGYWGTTRESPVYAPVAALMLRWVEHSQIRGCRFEGLGEGAVTLGVGSSYNLIEKNSFEDVGANVIQVGYRESFVGDGHPLHKDFANPREVSHHNVIRNNHLRNFATTDQGSVGIWIGYAHHNEVLHNLLEDFPYSGMSIGWRWDTLQTNCHHNLIAWNEVRDGMKYLSDGAGIYLVGNQPGTRVLDNWIHNIGGGYTINAGIYVDEGGANIELARNYFQNLTNPREAYPIKLHKIISSTMRIHGNGGEQTEQQIIKSNQVNRYAWHINVPLGAPAHPEKYGPQ
ncbi:hypothetical protein GCM10027275_21480 [Rhabdobacter roseus]|uniref:Right handed beta helix domain-containing protein n=1 Tax=Rhabdobacter roseus TaxID=1655419 RepID=A0A840TS51_9BACT|nr:right-handed parallel beta-helix repeat-containing protein [Rhabdobacter roseus]MBB5284083.1 hypothetical protein [Rhabdobacter roseus]